MKGDETSLSKLANNVTGIVRCYGLFVHLMNTVLNFFIAFKKECNEKFNATSIVFIVNLIMRSYFLSVMSTKSYKNTFGLSKYC